MSSSSGSARHGWGGKARGHLALARVSNSPTVVSNTLAGAALGGALLPGPDVLLVAAAMVLFYTAGMYLNDLCDYRVDLRERPERPLPSGVVSRKEAVAGVALMLTLGGVLLLSAGPAPFISGVVLIGLIILYDAWHKTNPLSPLLMASTRAMVYVTAFLALAGGPGAPLATRSLIPLPPIPLPLITLPLISWAVLLALYIVALTHIAKAEGKRGVMRFWPAAALFLPAAYFALQTPSLAGVLLLATFALWLAYSLSFVYSPERRSFPKAIAFLIAGVSLLDALVLSAMGSAVGVGLALAAFALTLLAQHYVRGT